MPSSTPLVPNGHISADDIHSTANAIALAIIENQEIGTTATGGITTSGKTSNGYTVSQAEKVALHIINTLISARAGVEPKKLDGFTVGKNLGDKLKEEYREEFDKLTSVLIGAPEDGDELVEYHSNLNDTLDNIIRLSRFPTSFADDGDVESNFALLNAIVDGTPPGELLSQEHLDGVGALRDVFLRDKSRFTAPKKFLTLPTGNWRAAAKEELTPAFRSRELDAFTNKVNHFLSEQKILSQSKEDPRLVVFKTPKAGVTVESVANEPDYAKTRPRLKSPATKSPESAYSMLVRSPVASLVSLDPSEEKKESKNKAPTSIEPGELAKQRWIKELEEGERLVRQLNEDFDAAKQEGDDPLRPLPRSLSVDSIDARYSKIQKEAPVGSVSPAPTENEYIFVSVPSSPVQEARDTPDHYVPMALYAQQNDLPNLEIASDDGRTSQLSLDSGKYEVVR